MIGVGEMSADGVNVESRTPRCLRIVQLTSEVQVSVELQMLALNSLSTVWVDEERAFEFERFLGTR